MIYLVFTKEARLFLQPFRKKAALVSLAVCAIVLLSCSCKRRPLGPIKQRISENRKLHRFSHQIYLVYSQHRVAAAIPLYFQAAAQATALGDYESVAKFLINAGGCQLIIFRYQDALGTMERARRAAEKTGDPDFIATANANIASLYMQMSNSAGATQAGERALAVLREQHPQYARVVIPMAQILAEQHDLKGAEPLIRRAIDGAYRARDTDTAAWAWDYLGYRYTLEHRLPEADRALTESLRLRKMFHSGDLGSSFYHLAGLRSEQGRNREARALLNSAIEEIRNPGNVTPSWNIYFARGQLLAKSGDRKGAWESLGKAVELARDWRTEIVANDANRTSAETALSDLYALYIEVGNTYAASQGISFARETFQAAEENRATSLRALAERETGWHNKLPARYGETLALLQDGERAVMQQDSKEARQNIAELRAVLDELEAASGVPTISAVEPAARATQKRLDSGTVLLSFQLGANTSWLWAVTKKDIAVFPLPSRNIIKSQIHEFQSCMRRGAPCAEQKGAALYGTLFGNLPDRFTLPQRWLFSLDQELFSLPMSALVVRFASGKPVYLGATHALQATPGALMFAASHHQPDFHGPLLGLGDPIYNRADPRWLQATEIGFVSANQQYEGSGTSFHFARLWGTADEIRAIAKTWTHSDNLVLTGAAASRERLWAELARKPAVIHFATHILEANDQLHTGWIALSIGADGRPEFLSPAEISATRISTGLVVLNGCSSGMGEIRAASGLMGLTRAWIAAGASNVLATRWPGPDDDGQFFVNFYQYLRDFPEKGPSFALLFACQKSIKEGGWRAKPQFWASYFLIGTD